MAKHDKRVKYHSEADKPVMLSLRVPRELNDRLERYASEHRRKSQSWSGWIEMRLEWTQTHVAAELGAPQRRR